MIVLVVEDNPVLRQLAVRQIVALGHKVLEAEDAIQATDILAGNEIDLLLTDIMIPGGKNGVELALEARMRDPAMKIVFSSGYADPDMLRDPRLDGIKLLSKPYRRQELLSLLDELLVKAST